MPTNRRDTTGYVSKFLEFTKQKTPDFDPVLSPLEALGAGGKQAGQDIPPERRIYVEENETAPTGTSGNPVPTYVGPKGGSFYDKNLLGDAGDSFKDFHDAVTELKDIYEEKGEAGIIQEIHDTAKKVEEYKADFESPVSDVRIGELHTDFWKLEKEVYQEDEKLRESRDKELEEMKAAHDGAYTNEYFELVDKHNEEDAERIKSDPDGTHARLEKASQTRDEAFEKIANARQKARDNDPKLQKIIKQHKAAEEKHKAFDEAERKVGKSLLASIKENGLDLDGVRVDIHPNLAIGTRSDWYALLKNSYGITPPKDMHWSEAALDDFMASSKDVDLGGRFLDKSELLGLPGVGDHLFPKGKPRVKLFTEDDLKDALSSKEDDPSLFVMSPSNMDNILKLKPHTDGGKNLSAQKEYEHLRGVDAMHTVIHEAMHSYKHEERHRGMYNLINGLTGAKDGGTFATNSEARDQMSHNLHMFLEESTSELLASHFIAKRYYKNDMPKTSEEHTSRRGKDSPYLNKKYNHLSQTYGAYTHHVSGWAMEQSGNNPKKARALILSLKDGVQDMGLPEGDEKREAAFKNLSKLINSYGTYLGSAKDIQDDSTGIGAPHEKNERKANRFINSLPSWLAPAKMIKHPPVKTQGFGLKQTDWEGQHSDDYYKSVTGRHERGGFGMNFLGIGNGTRKTQNIKDSHMNVMDIVFGADTEADVKKSLWKEDSGGGFGGDAGAGTVFTSSDAGVFTPTYGGSSAKHRTTVQRKKRKKKTGIERLGSWLTDFSPEKKSLSKGTATGFAIDLLLDVTKEYKSKTRKLRNKIDTKLPENETVTNYRPKILDWKKKDDDNAGALTYAKALDTESSGEEGKVKQEQAGFRQATPFEQSQEVQCGACIFFKADDNECQLVTGYIKEDTWCNLYISENKPKPNENEVVEGKDIQKARDLNDYFSNEYPMQSDKLKRRIIREAVFPRECASCKCIEWKGSVVPLELNHINGDHGDNAKHNLELICPNCHALTPHYRVKKPGAKSAIDLHGGAPKGDPRRNKSLDKDLRKEASEDRNPDEWGSPTKHHTDVLHRKYNVLVREPDSYIDLLDAPPDNDLEIETIRHYQEDAPRVEKDINSEDKDNVKPFLDYLKDNKLSIDETYLNNVNKDVNRIVYHVKFKFNRPRPSQVSDIKPTPKDGGYSPSYPSGHATQATVMAGILSNIYPEHSEDFSKIADKIGQNRLRAGLHYPSDHRAGQALGMEILEDVPSIDTEHHLKKRLNVMTEEEREVGATQQVQFHDPKYVETDPKDLNENLNTAVLEQNEFMERLEATTAKHVGDKKDDSGEKSQIMVGDAAFGPELRLSDVFDEDSDIVKLVKEDESFRKIVEKIFEES